VASYSPLRDYSLHLDFASVFLCLREVVFHLHAKPDVRAAARSLGKSDGHFWGNSGLPVDKIIEGLARDSKALGRFFYG
jgi:hypothetical protein